MTDRLALLVADGVIDEVLARLKSGKEADIYLVQHAGEIVVAKVYKERHVRSFKNNAAYKEGRAVRNSRTQRAMERGSRFGRAAEEDAWKAKESEALHTLFAAGVRVPRPHLFYEGVLLMEAVIDAAGHPAPRLIDAAIPRELGAKLYADLRQQVVGMLMRDLIHGDLSPYNVLLGWNGPTVIDFPQVVGAAHNSQAEFFFQRDLETLRRFFASIDPSLSAHAQDAREIWRAYVRQELSLGFVPTGRSEPAVREPRPPAYGGQPNRQGAQNGAKRELPNGPGGGRRRKRRGQRGKQAPTPGPTGQGRPGPEPSVSYLGRPSPPGAPTAEATAATGPEARRRRRRRRGQRGGKPPGHTGV